MNIFGLTPLQSQILNPGKGTFHTCNSEMETALQNPVLVSTVN